ncbi:hypothetical protein [Streptomyces sp. NPDC058548]|uniref:hypothetical protein n=1 Tax=Streptomyces sp. NPDC058548 TaxID=3346545 RepID=UPI003660D2AD
MGVRRATALTANAGPEPVRKGATLTVTGRLTAANWNSNAWSCLSGNAELQFCIDVR